MRSWLKFAAGVAVGALVVIALVVAIGIASAQPPTPQGKQPTPAPTPGDRNPFHEEMSEWMDQMMGPGFSEKMHEAMPEEMIEACNSMMQAAGQDGANSPMGGMMGPGGMGNMMGGNGTGGMMGSGMMGGARIY